MDLLIIISSKRFENVHVCAREVTAYHQRSNSETMQVSAAQDTSSLHSPIWHMHLATIHAHTLHLSHMHVLYCMCAH